MSGCDFSAIAVGGGHGHELEACRGWLVENLNRVSRGGGGGSGRDRLEGPDYGIAHEISDRAMKAEDEVVLGGPPCSCNGVSVESSHRFVGQVGPDDVSYFSEQVGAVCRENTSCVN